MKYYIQICKIDNKFIWYLVYSLLDKEKDTEYSTYIEISKELFYELDKKFCER